MHRLFLVLALSALCAPTWAQDPVREALAVVPGQGQLEVVTRDGRYRFKALSPRVIETRFVANGDAEAGPSHTVEPSAYTSPAPTTLRETPTEIEYATAGIAVTIRRSPLRIAYHYRGKPLLAERQGYRQQDGKDLIEFDIDASEALYGGGARALGMKRRGHKLTLYNRAHYGYEERSGQMSYTLPVVLSSKRYMIHFDDPGIGQLDLGRRQADVLAYETIGQRRTYQVIVGDHWPELLESYTALTGRQPLPPRWALGNFASRFGYRSEAQARETVARYKSEDIPLDVIVLDLYWFGKDMRGSMGNFSFEPDNFPAPGRMIADFAAQGVKTILISQPFVLTKSTRWPEALQRQVLATDTSGAPAIYDFYFGNTGLIDIFKPEARTWFWGLYKDLRAIGVAGWWGDLGEPEVHPATLRHVNGTADQVHNIYGHEWARLIDEGYRADFPLERPFILMRAGYSGSQRHGLIPWSGDVSRSWGGLRSQPEIALQMGMQGLGYMHSDLGGFAGPNLDDELYTRWLQYGVFQPIFRPHGQEEVASEPVYRAPKAMALAREAIRLRYRMLPYNYSLAFENSQTGMPLMRPLLFAEPDNPALQTVAETYFWGPDFLVAPVTAAGQARKEVIFPKTGVFFDFYTDERHAGGVSKTFELRPDRIPVFVRAGAFVPLAPDLASTEQYTTRALELHYYHDASVGAAQGQLYDDDGVTRDAHGRGRYEILKFSSRFNSRRLAIDISSEIGAQHQPPMRSLSLHLHGLQRRPSAVRVGRDKLAFSWDARRKLLVCQLQADPRQTTRIELQL